MQGATGNFTYLFDISFGETEQVSEWMDAWLDGRTHGRTYGWTDGWMGRTAILGRQTKQV